MAKVSIIIPLYNKAPYLEKGLQSVKDQTFTDWECIIVDDGSTDGSGSLAEQFTDGDSRFRVIHQANAGVSAARNAGVAASTGEYVCFLDADDWWASAFLAEMLAAYATMPDAGILGCAYYYVKNGRQRVDVCPLREDGVPMNVGEKAYINYFRSYAEGAMPLWTGAVLIPRFVMEEVKREDGYFSPQLRLGEDFDLWCRIALRHKVGYINSPLAYYNNDVPVTLRAVGRLQDPSHHMLWTMQWLEPYEAENADLKRLMDKLRVYSMKSYFLSKEYHSAAEEVLVKVDWSAQPARERRYYRMPLFLLRAHARFMRLGSFCKQKLIKLLHA